MNKEEKHFCLCTFAAGPIYRSLVKNLVSDIEKYAPGTPLILFTDKPSEFSNNSHFLVFKHRRQGVLCYHERRFAIAKALSMFNSCMYLDADVRICAPVSQDIVAREWLPGITARSCTSMTKHFRTLLNDSHPPSMVRKFEFTKKMARKLDLDLEADQVPFINEFLFVVTRDAGREVEFLEQWGKLATYCELNGIHNDPAFAMGLAATKVGFAVRHDVMEGLDFFDDRIEAVRIAKGQSDPEAKKVYFEMQKKLEYPHRSTPQKIMRKLGKFIDYGYQSTRLKTTTLLKDFDFYYR
jgi:hypothetical protein